MAYQNVSFSAGETLTATKMNQMAANDAAFHDGTGIAPGAITADKIDFTTSTDSAGWRKVPISDNVVMYFKKGSTSRSMGGNTWTEWTASTGPTDLNTSHAFFGGAGGLSSDHAISVSGYIADNGKAQIQNQNIYDGTVSTSILWWAFIIEILA